MRNTMICLLVVIPSLLASEVQAQTLTARFLNLMQSQATVRITPVGSTTPTEFEIGPDIPVTFSFSGENFDIQVIPRDEPDSGFRFANVNLREALAESVNGVITLDGKFAPGRVVTYCYRGRCCHRRRCYSYMTRGERIEVDLTSPLRGGRVFSVASPKMSYEQVMGLPQ